MRYGSAHPVIYGVGWRWFGENGFLQVWIQSHVCFKTHFSFPHLQICLRYRNRDTALEWRIQYFSLVPTPTFGGGGEWRSWKHCWNHPRSCITNLNQLIWSSAGMPWPPSWLKLQNIFLIHGAPISYILPSFQSKREILELITVPLQPNGDIFQGDMKISIVMSKRHDLFTSIQWQRCYCLCK